MLHKNAKPHRAACVRVANHTPNAFTLIEVLVVISIIALLIGILLPALSAARKSAQMAASLSNIRQIGMAMYIYAMDHRKGLYPDGKMAMLGNNTWMKQIDDEGFIKDDDVFRSPIDDSPLWLDDIDPRETSYGINAYFASNHPPYTGNNAIRIDDVINPSDKILLGEIVATSKKDHFMPMTWGSPDAVFDTAPLLGMGGMPAMMGNMLNMARVIEWDTVANEPLILDIDRFKGVSNYAFADGHARNLPFEDTWQQDGIGTRIIDRYDPKF